MIVTIHQPNYLPYLGFFDKMKKSDVFIIYDDAQFNKEDFQHRNRIRIYHGWKWLTVPVEKKRAPINQITIKNDIKISGVSWREAHFRDIHDNYGKAPYYEKCERELSEIYDQQCELLIDLNMQLIKLLMKYFDIDTKIVYSSEFGFNSKSTGKLVELVEAVGGDTYLSGAMGKNYLDVELFSKKDIKVAFQEFVHPIYRQQYDGFIPYMSAIDALFNVGGEIIEYEQQKA